MPKHRDTLDTTQLMLELLHRIPRVRKATASDLHQQLQGAGLDRDLRTIQRQLEVLSQHFDIDRDERTKPYRYRWTPYEACKLLDDVVESAIEQHKRYSLQPIGAIQRQALGSHKQAFDNWLYAQIKTTPGRQAWQQTRSAMPYGPAASPAMEAASGTWNVSAAASK